MLRGCISFDSYIKPQPKSYAFVPNSVVYLLIPTSNHNYNILPQEVEKLYIFWFLHQTTTCGYVVMVLNVLYIFWFLHQTTTMAVVLLSVLRCISFDSYIKPQQLHYYILLFPVVYLLIPTSNHNLTDDELINSWLYIFWFLHQTTTYHRSTISEP